MLRAIDFHGLKGVEFSKGEYTALLIPEMGANLVRLANTRLGAEILRTPGPGEIETFRSRPQVFGLPILFPPNRIADGRYVFEGRTYQYPITIERERNYHHGVLKSEAFLVSKARFEDQLQFLRLHLPGEVFAAGVPLFRQFQKIHLQRF